MAKLLLFFFALIFCVNFLYAQDINEFKGSEKKTPVKVPPVAPPKSKSSTSVKIPAKEKRTNASLLDSSAASENADAEKKADGLVHVNFNTNSNCKIFIDGTDSGVATTDNFLTVNLLPGNYEIEAVSVENSQDKVTFTRTLGVDQKDKTVYFSIPLIEVSQARKNNEKLEADRIAAEKEKQAQEAKIAEDNRKAEEKRKAEEETPEKLLIKSTLNAISADMVYIYGGSYSMGNASGNNDELPVHTVEIPSFYAAKYEVTQKQWQAIMQSGAAYNLSCDDCPVENISWYEVAEFIKKLNSFSNSQFRLLTEAEWEYVSRGGTSGSNFAYSGSNSIKSVGWAYDNGGGKPHAVGKLNKNNLGMFDLTGNVAEWCSDWYSSSYIKNQGSNPTGPLSGKSKVVRGGSYEDNDGGCRNTSRDSLDPNKRKKTIGFRLAKSG